MSKVGSIPIRRYQELLCSYTAYILDLLARDYVA